MPNAREVLQTLVRERAFRHSPDEPFTLASGAKSPFYFNCKLVTLSGAGLVVLGEVLLDAMKAFPDARAIGGLTLGADPMAVSLAQHASREGRALDAFVIRKEAKGHGTKLWVEGGTEAGTPVVILDDVVTTGGSTVKAIERATENGLKVVGALVLVDREEFDGIANVERALEACGAPPKVVSVFKASEFLAN